MAAKRQKSAHGRLESEEQQLREVISRGRWLVETRPRSLQLINPPETARSYSDSRGISGSALSVLGSKGEWRVASSNRSRWLTLSLGGLRCVTAIVIQSGSLVHNFSGWITAFRLEYSTAEALPSSEDGTECWTEVERELITGCSSDPVVEHRVVLRKEIWARHIKLIPTKWKVAAALASSEDLTPKISMRAAVLSTLDQHVLPDPAALAQQREHLVQLTDESNDNTLVCLFNLRHGCCAVAHPAHDVAAGETLVSRRAAGPLVLIGAAGARKSVGSLRPCCLRGDCVELSGRHLGVVLAVEDVDGTCTVLTVAAPNTQPQRSRCVPLAIVGEFDWVTRTFRMDAGRTPPLWAADSLPNDAGNVAPAPIEGRLCLTDEWLFACDWLDAGDACTLEVGQEEGSVPLALKATALAYGCSRGTRLALTSHSSHQEASCTVVGVDPSGDLVISIDNTNTLKAFTSWSTAHFGKASRTVLHGVRLDARPSTVVLSCRTGYAAGTRLLVLRGGALVDATVVQWLGAAYGNRHRLHLPGEGIEISYDVNPYNHTPQCFESAVGLEAVRASYCAALMAKGQWVEDAITGRKLKIEEQLLNITMASGEVRAPL